MNPAKCLNYDSILVKITFKYQWRNTLRTDHNCDSQSCPKAVNWKKRMRGEDLRAIHFEREYESLPFFGCVPRISCLFIQAKNFSRDFLICCREKSILWHSLGHLLFSAVSLHLPVLRIFIFSRTNRSFLRFPVPMLLFQQEIWLSAPRYLW